MKIQKNKDDPRVKRTRQLLKDAFISLVQEKDFESITIRDITEKATVNRATFYAHFTDKFEILEATITRTSMTSIADRISGRTLLNAETIQCIFLALCDFHKDLSTLCQKSYQSLGSVLEVQIKQQIQAILLSLLIEDKRLSSRNEQLKNTAAIMISWGIYGAAYSWNHEGRQLSAESFVEQTMPLVMNGAKELLDEEGL
jgi:AcrR family transcriptional regulator